MCQTSLDDHEHSVSQHIASSRCECFVPTSHFATSWKLEITKVRKQGTREHSTREATSHLRSPLAFAPAKSYLQDTVHGPRLHTAAWKAMHSHGRARGGDPPRTSLIMLTPTLGARKDCTHQVTILVSSLSHAFSRIHSIWRTRHNLITLLHYTEHHSDDEAKKFTCSVPIIAIAVKSLAI